MFGILLCPVQNWNYLFIWIVRSSETVAKSIEAMSSMLCLYSAKYLSQIDFFFLNEMVEYTVQSFNKKICEKSNHSFGSKIFPLLLSQWKKQSHPFLNSKNQTNKFNTRNFAHSLILRFNILCLSLFVHQSRSTLFFFSLRISILLFCFCFKHLLYHTIGLEDQTISFYTKVIFDKLSSFTFRPVWNFDFKSN